jgi:prepilin-type N-terminal cleavage/methylation domain-containing protein
MKKAFSLMEMLIVMAIIGILAATIVMGINSFLPHWQLSGSARLLTSKLRQAQEEAVTTQKQHRIYFNSTVPPVSFQLVKVDSGDQVLETIALPKNISLQLNIANPITFSADGGPDTNGSLILNLGGTGKTIEISPAGIIKLQ